MIIIVEYELPKKKEFLLYAPLTRQQKELYDAILNRNIRPFLLEKKLGREFDGDTTVDCMDIEKGNNLHILILNIYIYI